MNEVERELEKLYIVARLRTKKEYYESRSLMIEWGWRDGPCRMLPLMDRRSALHHKREDVADERQALTSALTHKRCTTRLRLGRSEGQASWPSRRWFRQTRRV